MTHEIVRNFIRIYSPCTPQITQHLQWPLHTGSSPNRFPPFLKGAKSIVVTPHTCIWGTQVPFRVPFLSAPRPAPLCPDLLRVGKIATHIRHDATPFPKRQGDESAGKKSHRNRSSSPARVKLLQPLLPHPQKRRWPATYSRSQTPESSYLIGSLDQHCSSPYFTWSIHTIWMPGINLRDDTQATVDPMAQPVLGVFSWLPWVLLPHESWCWVIPRHSTTWLYLFPYKRLRPSTSKISKGNVLSYYRNLCSLRYGTSTAFPISHFFQRNLRCGGEGAVYIARRPSILAGYGGPHSHRLVRRRWAIGSFFSPARTNGHAVSLPDYKKASVEKEKKKFFPYKRLRPSTRSISQGTEVTIVTEYIFS